MGLFFILLQFLEISGTTSLFPGHQCANTVAEVSNRLAVDLHKKLSVGSANVFFSPISISTALAMLFYGTKGRTADEMRRALGYQQAGLTDNQVHFGFQCIVKNLTEDSVHSASKEYLLHLANAMFIQQGYPILDEYKTGLQEIYLAMVRNVDFQMETGKVVQEINDWVKHKTNNKISELLDHLDPNTTLFLINAVYFKGTWKTKFEHTMDRTFFNNGLETEKVKTPMMEYEKRVPYTRLKDSQAIELPYKGEDIGMIIILPDALDGLSKLEHELTPNTLKNIRRSARNTRGVVIIPKFKLQYKETLNGVLQDLGVKNVFETSANLSGISKAGNLAVSEIVHKAVVEVNEEGTEAAAVTGIGVKVTSAVKNEIRFVADHPFFFAIVDNRNDLVLFQGRVTIL